MINNPVREQVLRNRSCPGVGLECCPLSVPAFTFPTSQWAFYPLPDDSKIHPGQPDCQFFFANSVHNLSTEVINNLFITFGLQDSRIVSFME